MNDTDHLPAIRELIDLHRHIPNVGPQLTFEAETWLTDELTRLHTWDGLMSLLDDHWPESIFPTVEDREDRDAGPRIVSLIRWVDQLRTERDEARREQATAYNQAIDADEKLAEARSKIDTAEEAWREWATTAQQQLAEVKSELAHERSLSRDLSTKYTALSTALDAGDASDGHHTHNELYRYRLLYNAHAARGWVKAGIPVVKSWRHHDGEECFGGGWFIVTAQLPTGQVSNHYSAEHWSLFDVPEVELPTVYDGHTPADAADRLHAALEVPSAD